MSIPNLKPSGIKTPDSHLSMVYKRRSNPLTVDPKQYNLLQTHSIYDIHIFKSFLTISLL